MGDFTHVFVTKTSLRKLTVTTAYNGNDLTLSPFRRRFLRKTGDG